MLVPYLTMPILRLYASQTGSSSAATIAGLYNLSLSLGGTDELQAAQYTLYKVLHKTFGWILQNVPLQLISVPGLDGAPIAWPAVSSTQLEKAVFIALGKTGVLNDTATTVEACCFSRSTLAGLVPAMLSSLQTLQQDIRILKVREPQFPAHTVTQAHPPHKQTHVIHNCTGWCALCAHL